MRNLSEARFRPKENSDMQLTDNMGISNSLKPIIEALPIGVIIIDAIGDISLVNNAACIILDWQLSGNKLPQHLKSLAGFLKKDEEVLDGEIHIRHRNGNDVFIQISKSPVYDNEGNTIGSIATLQDITTKRNAEIDLKRLAAIVEFSHDSMVSIDLEGTITSWNPGAKKLYGYTQEEMKGNTMERVLLPENQNEILEMIEIIKADRKVEHYETKRINRKGEIFYVSLSVSPIKTDDSKIIGISLVARDITEKKKITEALIESETRFRNAFDNAAIGMTLVSLEGDFIKANSALSTILGYNEEELLRLSFHDITHKEDLDKDLSLLRHLVEGDIPYYHMEKRYYHKKGHTVWGLLSVSLVRDVSGKPLYCISQIQDITRRKTAEEELQQARDAAEILAQTDFLTGILNRRAFNGRLDDELAKRLREKSSLCLVLADIDYFKKVNDVYGHNIGDLVLQQFAKCLSGICRQYDFIGRHGGEEFLICLPSTTCEQARDVAERMRKAAEEMSIKIPGSSETIHITASFGVARIEKSQSVDINTLIAQADSAMYSAKQSGRNRVKTYN